MAEKKGKIRSMISDYLMILLGSCIVSVGFVFFINPYKFVPGGVYGTSIVLHNLMPQLQVGTFGYIVGIPLLILSYFVLGKGLGAKTLFTTLVTPCIMNILSAAYILTSHRCNSSPPTRYATACSTSARILSSPLS